MKSGNVGIEDKINSDTIVAVIPARAGSKGVPFKNLRKVGFRPLIEHTIDAALRAKYIDRVVVSTDSKEIRAVAVAAGAEVPFLRPPELADDKTPLAVVMRHFLDWAAENNWNVSTLVILEPTSPLRSAEMITKAIELFYSKDVDTVISVVRDNSLYWQQDDSGEIIPLQSERVNRQFMKPLFKENGAIFVTRADSVTSTTTIGSRVSLFEMDEVSSVDINTFWDMYLANVLLRRVKILFHFKASRELGFGHFYRVLTLANHLYYHDIVLLCSTFDETLIRAISTIGFKYYLSKDPIAVIKQERPTLLINDILDTDAKEMREMRKLVPFIVNFEDLGEGKDFADLVFNALYEDFSLEPSHYGGAKYAILRDEFLFLPYRPIKEQVELITATFGGTDPNNIALQCMRNLPPHFPHIKFRIIVGPGYSHDKTEIKSLAERYENAQLIDTVTNMAEHLFESDIVITSGGRTVFEAAACGTPCVVICQNTRELKHRHITARDGVINLGLFEDTTIPQLVSTLEKLCSNVEIRRVMSERGKSLVDGLGIHRVIGLIEKTARKKGVLKKL